MWFDCRLLEYSAWIRIAEGHWCLLTRRHSCSNLPDVSHMAPESLEKFPHRPYVDFSKNNQTPGTGTVSNSMMALETVIRGDSYNHHCIATASGNRCGGDSLTFL